MEAGPSARARGPDGGDRRMPADRGPSRLGQGSSRDGHPAAPVPSVPPDGGRLLPGAGLRGGRSPARDGRGSARRPASPRSPTSLASSMARAPSPRMAAKGRSTSRLIEALGETLTEFGRTSPVVLFLDDLEWADALTLHFLALFHVGVWDSPERRDRRGLPVGRGRRRDPRLSAGLPGRHIRGHRPARSRRASARSSATCSARTR